MSNTPDSALAAQHLALLWGRGDSPLLLVAPHGGRRPPVDAALPPPHLRVNDVYTPEITLELAGALNAGFLINRGIDRNVLDLNRISQVRRDAGWFLDLLVQELALIIARHGCAELLFVHGWNTGQPKCDIGIGAVETDSGLQVPDGAHLTVREEYVQTRIAWLRAACARASIPTAVGERYPGSHRNNLLQLFTERARGINEPGAQRIAAWVADGRINALQLELGIPLRWPGVWRERFVAAVGEAFGEDGKAKGERGKRKGEQRTPEHSALRTAPSALQFYDSAAGVGMFAGIGRLGPRTVGGRVLLFLGGQQIALFTGEDTDGDGNRVAPLELDGDGESMRLRFSGPMLVLDDAAIYLDLEAALAASRLVEAEIDLRFAAAHTTAATAAQFGTIRGAVGIGNRLLRVEAGAFANAGGFRASGASEQTMIAAVFANRRAVLVRGAESSRGIYFSGDRVQWFDGRIAVSSDTDVYTPESFELACDVHPPLHGWPLSRMAILRPAGAGAYLRVTFGVARFEWDGEEGYGLYEHARPVVVSPA